MTWLLMLILCMLWGLSFLGTKALLDVLAPMEILAVRWMLAFVMFALLVAFRVIKVDYRDKPVRKLLVAAALQPCLYSILETWGVKLTTASETSIFIALVPLVVVLMNRLFFKRNVNRKVLFAIVLSFAGVLVCVLFSPGFSAGSKLLGYLILIGAVTAGSGYTVYSVRIGAKFTPMEITFVLTIAGSVFFNVLSLAEGNGLRAYAVFFSDFRAMGALLYLGIGCSCVAYMIFNLVLSRLRTEIVATVQTNLITVIGVVAGILLGGEPWGWYTAVGLVMTVTGICISALADSRQEPEYEMKMK